MVAAVLGAAAIPAAAWALVRRDGEGESGAGPGLISWPDAAPTGTAQGQRAPNFRLDDLDGTSHALDAAVPEANGAVVLNFFATWCVSCRDEMPVLDAAHAAGVTVLGIDLREDAPRVRALADETGIRYPVLLDTDGSVTRAYGATGLPTNVILAADGVVHQVIVGPVTTESLAESLAGVRADQASS
jgi:thiol-disulfide isomerase/thioredoxin